MTADSLANNYLDQNRLLNIDMIEMLRHGRGRLVAASERGVLISTPHPRGYAISSDDPDTATRLIRQADRASLFIVHQSFYLEEILGGFGLDQAMPCFQAAYFKSTPISQKLKNVKIEMLDSSHIDFVLEHYSLFHDRQIMLRHLESKTMFGAWLDDRLAGFVGMHDTGALGMLEVIPPYRRQGIGEALQIHMTNWQLEQGYISFTQIQVDNRASIALQKKLGYEMTDSNVTYLFKA